MLAACRHPPLCSPTSQETTGLHPKHVWKNFPLPWWWVPGPRDWQDGGGRPLPSDLLPSYALRSPPEPCPPAASCAPILLRIHLLPSVLAAGSGPGVSGVPGHSSSLPELQCFISDSQLTRDAALHLGLGDMEEPVAALAASCAMAWLCVWLLCWTDRLHGCRDGQGLGAW